MISLRNGTSQEEGRRDLRTLYLARLQEIADCAADGSYKSSTATVEADAAPPALGFSVPPPSENAKEEQRTEPEMTAPSMDAVQPASGPSDEFRRLAEQVAPKWIEALTDAIRGMHRMTTGDRGKLEAAIDSMTALSDDVRSIRGELTSLRRSTDLLEEAECALSVKVAGVETRLCDTEGSHQRMKAALEGLSSAQDQDRKNQDIAGSRLGDRLGQMEQRLRDREGLVENRVAGALEKILAVSDHLEALTDALEAQANAAARLNATLSTLKEGQESLQRRLNLQSEAIRALYTTEQERRNQLETALKKVQDMATGFLLPGPLPEQL